MRSTSICLLICLLASISLTSAASYSACQTAHGFFKLVQKAFSSAQYQETIQYRLQTDCSSCSLTNKLLMLMELIVQANQGQLAVVTQSVDMTNASVFSLLVTYTQSMIVDGSPVLINITQQALSSCAVDLSDVVDTGATSWALYSSCY